MSNTEPQGTTRRDVLRASAAAAFTTMIFPKMMRGANDKLAVGFIGTGTMGQGNVQYALQTDRVQAVSICDVYQPNLEKAIGVAKKFGQTPKGIKDFREVLADKSIDAVCIATPDHWHAYIEVEACKAGKDVYVEKPACVWVEEGQKMVQAARKYNRVVQGGTMQRSGGYFKKAAELIQAGEIGQVTFCHEWQAGMTKKEGWGKRTNEAVPAGLDWEMWQGPAQARPYSLNRFGVSPDRWSTFRYFWDYAGGSMTDWGVHLVDPIHQAMGEPMPKSIVALGSKFFVEDDTQTPDTMQATFQYEKFLSTYESRTVNPMPMFGQDYGTSFHGTKGTLVLNRGGVWVYANQEEDAPRKKPNVADGPVKKWENDKAMSPMNVPHWNNFLDCIKSREKPISDIEKCVRSSVTCILANLSMRFESRLDWDENAWTVKQDEVKPHLKAIYRAPWKLEV
jgi:predicted dehydrogenase